MARTAYPSRAPGVTPVFDGGLRCSYFWFSILCFFLVFLRTVSLVSNVDSFSGLAILDCPLAFCHPRAVRCKMMFVLFKSNTTGTTKGAETSQPPKAPELPSTL